MARWKRVVLVSILVCVLTLSYIGAFAAFYFSRLQSCERTRNLWDGVHAVIDETDAPSGTTSALTHLRIPPTTDPEVIDILVQLQAAARAKPNAHALDRFYDKLGPRPRC